MKSIKLSIPLPNGIYDCLRNCKRRAQAGIKNIVSDRDIEYGFLVTRIPSVSGDNALDLGFSCNQIGAALLQSGYKVKVIDLMPQTWCSFASSDYQYIQDDFLSHDFSEEKFRLIVNCSTVEHIGLSGRYNNQHDESDGDLAAMRKAATLLEPNGKMLLTVPVGKDMVFAPYHRVYGEKRLPQLLEGYRVLSEFFWRKNSENKWSVCSRQQALSEEPELRGKSPSQVYYALGCFELGR